MFGGGPDRVHNPETLHPRSAPNRVRCRIYLTRFARLHERTIQWDCWDELPRLHVCERSPLCRAMENQFASHDRKAADMEPALHPANQQEIRTADSWAWGQVFRLLDCTVDERHTYNPR